MKIHNEVDFNSLTHQAAALQLLPRNQLQRSKVRQLGKFQERTTTIDVGVA
jgi:hypothetical protein